MRLSKPVLPGTILILLLSGCLRPPVSGKIICSPQALACKEFTTIEGIHVKFFSCGAHVYKRHIDAMIYCTLSNPTDKDLLLRRRDFRIVSLDSGEMVDNYSTHIAVMADNYLVKKGQSEDYIFSAHTVDKYTQKDFKEFRKNSSLAFLHQGANLTPDTLFTMQWKRDH